MRSRRTSFRQLCAVDGSAPHGREHLLVRCRRPRPQLLGLAQDLDGLPRQRDPVLALRLHPRLRHRESLTSRSTSPPRRGGEHRPASMPAAGASGTTTWSTRAADDMTDGLNDAHREAVTASIAVNPPRRQRSGRGRRSELRAGKEWRRRWYAIAIIDRLDAVSLPGGPAPSAGGRCTAARAPSVSSAAHHPGRPVPLTCAPPPHSPGVAVPAPSATRPSFRPRARRPFRSWPRSCF